MPIERLFREAVEGGGNVGKVKRKLRPRSSAINEATMYGMHASAIAISGMDACTVHNLFAWRNL